MSFFKNLRDSLTNGVKSTVVSNRVEKAIDELDSESVVNFANLFGKGMQSTLVSMVEMGTKALSDNKKEISELAGNNANTIIALDKAIKNAIREIKPLISKLESEENVTAVKSLSKTLTDTYAKWNVDMSKQLEKEMVEPADEYIDKICASVGYDNKTALYYILKQDDDGNIVVPHEHINVDEKRYRLRQTSNKLTKYDGTTYHFTVRNKTYESTPETYLNLKANEKEDDTTQD